MTELIHTRIWRGAVLVLCSLSTALAATPEVAGDRLELRYEAFVAGIPAGEAIMQLQREPPIQAGASAYRYSVAGSARSTGLWESFQQWRAEYSVNGKVIRTLAEGDKKTGVQITVSPGHFFSLQTTPRKRREIHIEDGILSETKNHKVRDPRPAQTGYDLLSALFFLPPCHPELRVHTGRDGYTLQRTGVGDKPATQPPLSCSYRVRDDEGGEYKMKLSYGGRGSFTVPVEIVVHGPVNGRMRLVEPVVRASSK